MLQNQKGNSPVPCLVEMTTRFKRILLLIVGWIFIVLGIAGLFLPILQGILFIVIGLIILSSEYVWAHKLLAQLRQRFPGIAKHADEASRRASIWMGRMARHQPRD